MKVSVSCIALKIYSCHLDFVADQFQPVPNTSYGISLLFGVWHLQSGGPVGSSKKSGPNEKWGGVCLE